MDSSRPSKLGFVSVLLAQLGAHGARRFAERLATLDLMPPHAGILRRLNRASGLSQRELASQLGMHASRLVGIVDEMEQLGLVVRESNPEDRRTYSLQITSKISWQHNEALCAALSAEERVVLAGLLERIADQQGLMPGVHPGFRYLSGNAACAGTDAGIETM